MKEKILSVNDQETSTTKTKELEKRKKIYLLMEIGIPIILVIIIIIIILILVLNKDESTKINSPIGEIICKLDIDSTHQNTQILGEDYSLNSKFDIYIDNKLSRYSKEYKFSLKVSNP